MPSHSRVTVSVLAIVLVFSTGAQQALAQAATAAIEAVTRMPGPMTLDAVRSHSAWQQRQSGLYALHGSRELIERLRQAGLQIPKSGLLYIGKAKDLCSRIGKHLRGNPQNSSFAKTLRTVLPGEPYDRLIRGLKVSMLPVADPAARTAMERRLIAARRPQLNIDSSPVARNLRRVLGKDRPTAKSPHTVPKEVVAGTVRASVRTAVGTVLKATGVGAAISILPTAAVETLHVINGRKTVGAALVDGGQEVGAAALIGAAAGGALTAAGVTLTAPVVVPVAIVGGAGYLWVSSDRIWEALSPAARARVQAPLTIMGWSD